MPPGAGSSSFPIPNIVQARGVFFFFFVKKGSEHISFCKLQLCGMKATIHNTYPMFLAKYLVDQIWPVGHNLLTVG